jgi:hypothetical protein
MAGTATVPVLASLSRSLHQSLIYAADLRQVWNEFRPALEHLTIGQPGALRDMRRRHRGHVLEAPGGPRLLDVEPDEESVLVSSRDEALARPGSGFSGMAHPWMADLTPPARCPLGAPGASISLKSGPHRSDSADNPAGQAGSRLRLPPSCLRDRHDPRRRASYGSLNPFTREPLRGVPVQPILRARPKATCSPSTSSPST